MLGRIADSPHWLVHAPVHTASAQESPPPGTDVFAAKLALDIRGRIAARGGFIPAETLVLNGAVGDDGTLHQPVLGFLVG